MKNRALFYVNVSVLLFGLAGIFARWIDLSALGITFGRVLFSSLSLFAVMLITRQPFRLRRKRDAALLTAAGVILAVHWWAFLESIQLATVAIGTITFSSFPLFVTFLEPLVFREKLQKRNLLIAAVILFGVIITIPEFSVQSRQLRGLLVGMLSALAYAVLTLLNKSFSGNYSGTMIAFYEQAVAALALLPAVASAGIRPTGHDVALLAILGIFTTALAHTLFINSLKSIPAQLAGVCSAMETVYGILFALILLNEPPTVRECLGAAIIVGVVVYSQLHGSEAAAS